MSVLPIVIALGGAVDFSRVNNGRKELQSAVDSAALALAGSAEQDTAELLTLGKEYIEANVSTRCL